MDSYIKSFMGTRLDIENEINEEARKKKAKVAGVSAFYEKGVFYAFAIFEKEKSTSERKRKATDC